MPNFSSLSELRQFLHGIGGTLTLTRQTLGDAWGDYLDQFWNGQGIGITGLQPGPDMPDRAAFSGFTVLPGAQEACSVSGDLRLGPQGRIDVSLLVELPLGSYETSRVLGMPTEPLLDLLALDGATLSLNTAEAVANGPAPQPLQLSRPGAQAPKGAPVLALRTDNARKPDSPTARLFGIAPQTYTGIFFFHKNSPCLFLSADTQLELAFGDQRIALRPHVLSHLPGSNGQTQTAALGFSTTLTLGSKQLVFTGKSGPTDPSSLYLHPDNLQLNGLNALASLLQLPELETQLPDPVQSLTNIALTAMQLDIATDPPTLVAADFQLEFDPVSMIPGVQLATLHDLRLEARLIRPFQPTGREWSATLHGSLQTLDTPIHLSGTAPEFTLEGKLAEGESIPVAAVLREMLSPLQLPWPKGIPQINLTRANLSLQPKTGEFDIQLGADMSSPADIGGVAFTLSNLQLHWRRKNHDTTLSFGARAAFLGILASLTAESPRDARGWLFQGQFTLAKPARLQYLFDQILKYQIQVNPKYLDFAVNHGHLAFALGGPYFYLDFGVTSHFGFGETARLESDFALFEFDGASGWRYGIKGGLLIPSLPRLGGYLQFTKEKSQLSLDFIPDEASSELPIVLPIPSEAPEKPEIVMALPALSLFRDNAGTWTITNTISVGFRHLPKTIRPILANSYELLLEIDSKGRTSLSARPFLPPYSHKLPDIPTPGGDKVSLGTLAVGIPSFGVVIDREVTLAADIALGIPTEANRVLGVKNGKPRVELFRTYDPTDPEGSTVNLELQAGASGATIRLLNSPIKAIETEEVDGKTYWNVDLGDAGAGRIQLPVFAYRSDRQAFVASGGFEITRDLQLPLDLLQNLFEAIGLAPLASVIPDAMPLMSFDLLDDRDQLDVERIDAFFDRRLPGPVKDALKIIGDLFDETPDRFRGFMRFQMPEKLDFEAEFGAGGATAFKFSSDPGIKIITMGAGAPIPLPLLNLTELRSLSFSQMLGGQLIGLSVDATIDRYDLLTLAASVALGKSNDGLADINLNFLPKAKDLRQTIDLRNVFAIIPYQSGLPIPIPVFYDRLGFDYAGIEGVGLGSEFKFPKPGFNLPFLAETLRDFVAFFRDRDALLDPNKDPKGMDLAYTIGANYLTLPKYLGEQTLGKKDEIATISLYQNLAHLLNWLKTFSVSELVQAFPPKYRIGQQALQTKFINLTLALEGGWVISTPDEFPRIPESDLPISPAERQALLLTLPHQTTPGEDGLIVLLRGKIQMGPGQLESQFALLATNQQGFATGIRIRGAISSIISIDVRAGIMINPYNPTFALNGQIVLKLLQTEIVRGNVSVNNQGIEVSAALNLFPDNPIVEIGGEVYGSLNNTGLDLYCQNGRIYVGGVKVIHGAGGGIKDNMVWLEGSFLGYSVRFRSIVAGPNYALQGQLTLAVNSSINLEVQTKVSKVIDGILNEVIEWVTKTFNVEASVTLTASIGANGFHGSIQLAITQPVDVDASFSIDITPKSLDDFKETVLDYIEDRKDILFEKLKFI